MPEFSSIIKQIMGDVYLFWLIIGLASMVLYSMADSNDNYAPLRRRRVENSSMIQAPPQLINVNEQAQTPTIPISGHLSSHSAPIIPGKYSCSRNTITDTGL
jgi:hypothetical protein